MPPGFLWLSYVTILREAYIYRVFLSDPGVPGVRSMGPDETTRLCSDLTDVTLADEDSNSIPTYDVNRAFLSNMATQVPPTW